MLSSTETYIKDCLRRLERPETPGLIAGFEYSSKERGELPAFKCLGKPITYGEVDGLSRDFAAYLLGACGLSKGDPSHQRTDDM